MLGNACYEKQYAKSWQGDSRIKLCSGVDPAANGSAFPDLLLHVGHSAHVAVLLGKIPANTCINIINSVK